MDANCERMNDRDYFLSLTSTYLSCSLFVSFPFCNCFRQCNVIVCDVHIIIHDFTDFYFKTIIEFGAIR